MMCVRKETDGHLEKFLPSLAVLPAKSLGVRFGGNWPLGERKLAHVLFPSLVSLNSHQ